MVVWSFAHPILALAVTAFLNERVAQHLLGCPHTASHFRPHPTIRGAYLLDGPPKQLPVTFNRSVLDTFGPAVTLLTYGTEELPALLASAGIDTTDPERPKIAGRELPDTLDAMEALIGSPETVPGR